MPKKILKIIQMLDSTQKNNGIILLVLMFFGMLLELVSIGAIIPIFSLIGDPSFLISYPQFSGYVSLFGNGENALIIAAISMLLFIYLFKTFFLSVLAWFQTKFVFEFQANISSRLFAKYLSQDYSFHIAKNSSILIRNVANETTQLANGAILCGLNVLLELLVIIGIATFLVYVEPFGAFVIIFSLSLTGIIFYLASKNMVLSWGIDRQNADGQRIQNIQHGLGGIKEIKLLGREARFTTEYENSNGVFANAARKQSFLLNLPRLVIEFIAILVLSILILILVSQGSTISSILPVLAVFAAAAFRLMPSINRVLGNYQTLQYSSPVIDLISAELELATNKKEIYANDDNSNYTTANLSIKGLDFSYQNESQKSLSNLNLTIKNGEMIGFIGESGSGKSTLVDIILGLLIPTKGEVIFCEKNIHNNIASWQSKIGYVPQNIYLIDNTLRRNIALGLPDEIIDENAVNEAIKMADLDSFIQESKDGLDTVVGERGVRLSGGQLQRIGIARALYHNPSILILDEATSALDSITESRVMNSIMKMKGTKTIIIVAHRLSTVERCDYLYKLNKGKITEEGPPNKVLQHEYAIHDRRK